MTVKTYLSDAKNQGKDLNDESLYLERRIQQMGFEGDCAYERAMYNFYLNRLNEVRILISSC
jgi:hypothetical protein